MLNQLFYDFYHKEIHNANMSFKFLFCETVAKRMVNLKIAYFKYWRVRAKFASVSKWQTKMYNFSLCACCMYSKLTCTLITINTVYVSLRLRAFVLAITLGLLSAN